MDPLGKLRAVVVVVVLREPWGRGARNAIAKASEILPPTSPSSCGRGICPNHHVKVQQHRSLEYFILVPQDQKRYQSVHICL